MVAAAARPGLRRERADGAHLAQRRPACAPGAQRPQPGPVDRERRRLQRDPRPRPRDPAAPHARADEDARAAHDARDRARRAGSGWVVNLHGSTHPFEQGQADQRLSHATALAWAGDGPLILGGDLNQTKPRHPGLTHVAGHHVDHVFARGWEAEGEAERIVTAPLSDHEALAVALRAEA